MMTAQDYAKRYGKTVRTILRWKAAGAPLDNPDLMAEWIAAPRRREPSEPTVTEDRKTIAARYLTDVDESLFMFRLVMREGGQLNGEMAEAVNMIEKQVWRISALAGIPLRV